MEQREQTLLGMKKLVYFPFNYRVEDMIDRIWGSEPELCGHIHDKFRDTYKYRGGGQNFFTFFTDLDDGNQRRVLEFVLDEYNGIRSV